MRDGERTLRAVSQQTARVAASSLADVEHEAGRIPDRLAERRKPPPTTTPGDVGCQVKGTTSGLVLPWAWDHLFAIDGTTWLAFCQLWDHPGVASGSSGCWAAVLAR